jgi:CRP-like cAMP-binding protein
VSAPELKRFSLLTEFTESEFDDLLAVLSPATVLADRTLFREGRQSDGLALLLEGTVRLESARTGHKARVGAGTALGALSLVGMGPRESTAVSVTPCELLWLHRADFRRLVDDSPRTACRLLEAIAGDLASSVRHELDCLLAT